MLIEIDLKPRKLKKAKKSQNALKHGGYTRKQKYDPPNFFPKNFRKHHRRRTSKSKKRYLYNRPRVNTIFRNKWPTPLFRD